MLLRCESLEPLILGWWRRPPERFAQPSQVVCGGQRLPSNRDL